MIAWAMVPARGGSKSIPYKNLVSLGGRPMLDWGVRAAQASGRFQRIICNTEDDRIAAHALALGIEVDRRPHELAGDETAIADVSLDFLARAEAEGKGCPDVLVLVQPTSPFLLPGHIGALLDSMAARPGCRSGQTITAIPHNHHAWNQREVEDGLVSFRFKTERLSAYNKQKKPKLFVFGNLVAVVPGAIADGSGFFAEPSVAVEIPRPYDLDLDGPEDLVVAEALVAAGLIDTTHLQDR